MCLHNGKWQAYQFESLVVKLDEGAYMYSCGHHYWVGWPPVRHSLLLVKLSSFSHVHDCGTRDFQLRA